MLRRVGLESGLSGPAPQSPVSEWDTSGLWGHEDWISPNTINWGVQSPEGHSTSFHVNCFLRFSFPYQILYYCL